MLCFKFVERCVPTHAVRHFAKVFPSVDRKPLRNSSTLSITTENLFYDRKLKGVKYYDAKCVRHILVSGARAKPWIQKTTE